MHDNQVNNKKCTPSGRQWFYWIIIILTAWITGFSSLGFAQEPLNSKQIEAVSYRLYIEHKWDSLIEFSKLALAANQDYYYLRLRYGIAFFEKHDYPNSVIEFEKARVFNGDDPVLLEYLYYAYVFSGRADDARILASKFPSELQKKIQVPKYKLLESIDLEIGGTSTDNISMNGALNMIGKEKIYSETLMFGKNNYYHAGISLRPLKWLSVYQSFALISQEVEQKITHRDFSTIISNGDTLIYKWFYDKMKQTEYYGNAGIGLGKGWTVTPAFHYVSVKLSSIQFDNSDTTMYFANEFDTIQSVKYNYKYPVKSSTIADRVYFLGISKRFQKLTIGLSGSLSNFSDGNQKMINGFITWYPKGNLNLYTFSNVSYFKEKQKSSRFVLTQMAGGRIWKSIWLEANITLGEITHFTEKSAFVTFNTPERIMGRYGASFILPVGNHLELSFHYLNYSRKGMYITYSDANTSTIKSYSYHNQSFIGGLKWKL